MTIGELSHDQKLALVALMEAVALADGEVGEGEQKEIAAVADALGEEAYRALLDEVDSKFASIDSLKQYLTGITCPEARETVFGLVWGEAVADPTIVHEESELMQWLAQAWGIEPASPAAEDA